MYKPKASGFLRVRSSTWMSTCLWRHFVWQVDPFRTTRASLAARFGTLAGMAPEKKKTVALGCAWHLAGRKIISGVTLRSTISNNFLKNIFSSTTLARSCIRQTNPEASEIISPRSRCTMELPVVSFKSSTGLLMERIGRIIPQLCNHSSDFVWKSQDSTWQNH